MKIHNYDTSLLIKECEDFLNYAVEEEMDNDCYPEEQILINAVSSALLALHLIEEKKNKEELAIEEKPMRVCERCLMAVESREGNQVTRTLYVDEDDDEESKCDWCEESGFDTLYELI